MNESNSLLVGQTIENPIDSSKTFDQSCDGLNGQIGNDGEDVKKQL